MTEDWQEFVRAHGQVIGFGDDERFIPVSPGEDVRSWERTARRFPWLMAGLRPVYGPATSGEGS